MKSTRPDDFRTEDAESWQEQFQADAETLRHRGFSFDFCGAWLAFWAYTAEHFGERLEAESERMRARLALPGESRDVILEKCRRTSMALMGALVRADKHRSEFRREKIPAWQLEAAARGRSTDFGGMPDEERRRVQRNLSRYWRRDGWAYIVLLQRVTYLPFFDKTSRGFVEGRGDTGLFYDPADNFIHCNREPSCSLYTIARAFGLAPYSQLSNGTAA